MKNIYKVKKTLEEEETQDYSSSEIVLDKNVDESDFICSLCSEIFINPVTTSCKHDFCKQCLKTVGSCWDKHCPTCNKNLTYE